MTGYPKTLWKEESRNAYFRILVSQILHNWLRNKFMVFSLYLMCICWKLVFFFLVLFLFHGESWEHLEECINFMAERWVIWVLHKKKLGLATEHVPLKQIFFQSKSFFDRKEWNLRCGIPIFIFMFLQIGMLLTQII